MRALVVDAVRASLCGATKVAFVGFPDHNNVGDSAIWLGTREVLADLGVEIGYVATWWSYDPQHLRDAVGDAPVVIHGGGNLGDRYRAEHQLRERVLRGLRDRPVVQFPQTVSFADPSRARRFARLAREHPQLQVMVRDRESAVVLDRLGVRCAVVPDMALAWGGAPPPGAPSGPTGGSMVWLARTDLERRLGPEQFEGADNLVLTDWEPLLGPSAAWPPAQRTASEQVRTLERTGRTGLGAPRRLLRAAAYRLGLLDVRPVLGRRTGHLNDPVALGRALDVLAHFRVERGCALLADARLVITDRLHAHLLSLLIGVPSVVYDNVDHKLSRYWGTWEPPAALATWVSGPDEAWALASGA